MTPTMQDDGISTRPHLRLQTAAACIKILVLCLLIGGCIEDRRADKAYQRGDYSKTIQELRYLADHGDLRAQYDLGVLYDKGQGVPQSDHEAMNWYRRAAEQGEARAQYNLGLMYANGQGVAQDLVEAYYWISLSAAGGDVHAMDARDYYAERMTQDQITQARQLLDQRALLDKKTNSCQLCDHLSVGSKPF
jgi:TPR repeat protein